MIRRLLLLLALGAAATSTLEARKSGDLELSREPQGFTWKKIRKIKAAFLMPNGWAFKSGEEGPKLTYFMTPHPFKKDAGFDVGFSLEVYLQKPDTDAEADARGFIDKMAREHELISRFQSGSKSLRGYGCQVRIPGAEGRAGTRIHYLAVASTITNTLYILSFKAPEAEWESAWEKGRVIMEVFVINNEV